MKKYLLLGLFSFHRIVAADPFPERFPDWVTDDKTKVWAVNQLMDFMKDREFYKISNIEVERKYSEVNKCDELNVNLTFDDPKCSGRRVSLWTAAPLCGEQGCQILANLTTCKPDTFESRTVVLH